MQTGARFLREAGKKVNEIKTKFGYWSGPWETMRLWLQNHLKDAETPNWGDTHFHNLKQIAESGLMPQEPTIAEIGIGTDASLLENLINAFPDAKKIVVIELNEGKINGAKKTLLKKGYNLDNVIFEAGNAAEVLKKYPETFDLVDSQCLLQHLLTKAPLSHDEKTDGHFATRKDIDQGMADATIENGLVTIGDLLVSKWQTSIAPGHEKNPEALAKFARNELYIKGGNIPTPKGEVRVPGAIFLGWDARNANCWKSASDIENAVTGDTNGRLKVIEKLSAEFPMEELTVKDAPTSIIACIPQALFIGVMGSINEHTRAKEQLVREIELFKQCEDVDERLIEEKVNRLEAIEQVIARQRGAAEFLRTRGQQFLEDCQEDPSDPTIIHTMPPMTYLTFQKTA